MNDHKPSLKSKNEVAPMSTIGIWSRLKGADS